MAKNSTTRSKVMKADERTKGFDLSNWRKGTLLTDQHGNTRCILGYMREVQPYEIPFYGPSVATHDVDGPSSWRFVELRHGALFKTSLPTWTEDCTVHSNIFLSLPTGSDTSFGVLDYEKRNFQLEMTQLLFGGTDVEIESVAKAFSRIIGRSFHDSLRLPRITFSKTRDNGCDLSNSLIPSNFPYLAFEQSQYAWGHISLYTFFRLLGFMCPRESAVRKALESEVDRKVIDQLIDAGSAIMAEPLSFKRF